MAEGVFIFYDFRPQQCHLEIRLHPIEHLVSYIFTTYDKADFKKQLKESIIPSLYCPISLWALSMDPLSPEVYLVF